MYRQEASLRPKGLMKPEGEWPEIAVVARIRKA
jgi:hypothetical protein